MCIFQCHLTFFLFLYRAIPLSPFYSLSLHDALPILRRRGGPARRRSTASPPKAPSALTKSRSPRSEEHTSELQSPCKLVCRLLLEKKKTRIQYLPHKGKSNISWRNQGIT